MFKRNGGTRYLVHEKTPHDDGERACVALSVNLTPKDARMSAHDLMKAIVKKKRRWKWTGDERRRARNSRHAEPADRRRL